MARWQRDPKARRQVALVVGGVEALLASVVFYFLFWEYCFRLFRRMSDAGTTGQVLAGVHWTTYIATAVFIVGMVVATFFYSRGDGWARWLFLGVNTASIVAGAALYLLSGGAEFERATIFTIAVVLPVVLLFPMLVVLWEFRPGRLPGVQA